MVSKHHCLACLLEWTYNEWCKRNGRAPVKVKLEMSAAFLASVIANETDEQLIAAVVSSRAADLIKEVAAATKH